MRNKNLSVILALVLVLTMVFCFTACGGGTDNGQEISGDTPSESNEGPHTPSALTEDDWALAEEGSPVVCDFGLTDEGTDWTMDGALEKLDYSDLGNQGETLETRTKEALEKSGLTGFEFYTDFAAEEVTKEEAEEYGIDVGDILYTSCMEDENMDNRFIETGAYVNPMEGNYYQYAIYSTENYEDVKDADFKSLSEVMTKAFGVSADEKLIAEGFKAAYDRAANYEPPEDLQEDEDAEEIDAEELELTDEDIADDSEPEEEAESDDEVLDTEEFSEEDFDFDELLEGGDEYSCTLQQTIEIKGDGYTDRVLLSISAQQVDKEEVKGGAIVYASVERNRLYD